MTTVDLNVLRTRALDDEPNSDDTFRPTWMYKLLEDPYALWCDYHAPDEEKVEETTLYNKYRMDAGRRWEQECVQRHFPEAYHLEKRRGQDALEETLARMLEGEEAIHGAVLWWLSEQLRGRADLLVRCEDASSDLGDYHYRVKEIKRSSSLKDYHKLQGAVYNRILGRLQGYTPETFDIVLDEETGEETIPQSSVQVELDRHLKRWEQIRAGELEPEPPGPGKVGSPWTQYADRRLQERGDLTLLPGVGASTRQSLRRQDVESIEDFLEMGEEDARIVLGDKKGHRAYWHARAYEEGKPVFAPGTTASIPRRPRHFHFDVENTTVEDDVVITRGHTYMLGIATPEGDTHLWTAHGEEDERRMWEEFLDWLGDPSDAALYCWTMYERKRLEQAMEDHPDLSEPLEAVSNALVDLKKQVKRRPFFPVPSYSIKKVAPSIGFEWSQDDVDGMSAGVLYKQWLETGDDAIIEKVRQYNRDDVLAMLHIDEWITEHAP